MTSEGANVREGGKVAEASGQAKVLGAKKKYRSRSASASSVDSVSSGSYTGSSSEDDDASPREKIQKNSSGFSDFCVRKIGQHSYGRREIEVRLMEMDGVVCGEVYDVVRCVVMCVETYISYLDCSDSGAGDAGDHGAAPQG